MKLISKKVTEINPSDIVVNIGLVKKVQSFSNHIMLTYSDNSIKSYKPTQELLLEQPSNLDNLFKNKIA